MSTRRKMTRRRVSTVQRIKARTLGPMLAAFSLLAQLGVVVPAYGRDGVLPHDADTVQAELEHVSTVAQHMASLLLFAASGRIVAPPTSGGPYEYLRPELATAPTNAVTGQPMVFNSWTGVHDGTSVNTTEPTWGSFVDVTDSGNAATNATNLQSAIDAAITGMTENVCLRLPATFVWAGPVVLRRKTDAHWLGIRTANVASLPELSPGTFYGTKDNRVTFAAHAAHMPTGNMAAGGAGVLVADSYEVRKYFVRGVQFANPSNITSGLGFARISQVVTLEADATAATSTTVTVASGGSAGHANMLLYVVRGTGAGQSRIVSSVASNTYTVSEAWTTPPDTTSRVVVFSRPFGVTNWGDVSFAIANTFPEDVVLAQCLADGAHPTAAVRRTVLLGGRRLAVIDGASRNIGQNGSDSQDVLIVSGQGPYKYTNCASSVGGASENYMSGGTPLFGPDATFLPRDIEVRGNYADKPLGTVAAVGGHKNHFEVKFGGRILIEGNVCGHHNAGGQQSCFVLKMTDQNGPNPATNTHDVLVLSNRTTKGPSGITMTGREFSPNNTLRPYHFEVRNNVFTPDNTASNLGSGLVGFGVIDGIWCKWNTYRAPDSPLGITRGVYDTRGTWGTVDTNPSNVVVTDNVFACGDGMQSWAMSGDAAGVGDPMFAARYTAPVTVERNLVNVGTDSRYTNQIRVAATRAAIGFVDVTASANLALDVGSAGKGAGAGGHDVGANWALVTTLTAQVI